MAAVLGVPVLDINISMDKKIKVGIIFGGKSAEHEASLQSAKNVIEALDKEKYEPVLIGINKKGEWFLDDQSKFLLNSGDPKLIKLNNAGPSVSFVPQSDGRITSIDSREPMSTVDVVFPVLHGPFGEDGTIQGLLKLANVPFVGASVLGSAVGMDKDMTKRLLRDAGLPIPKFIAAKENEAPSFDEVVQILGLPVFIKPANMGSSVGISKVKDENEYKNALTQAFAYDRKIMIEENIDGREIECAVLGNDEPIVSVPGEIIPSHDFYSYEAKYIDEHGANFQIPANLPEETIKTIQALAIKTFKTIGCEGMGRVDFFLKNNGEVLINEINTIPGFTSISMYPKLWAASGIKYSELIDRLIGLAMERFAKEQKLKTSYDAEHGVKFVRKNVPFYPQKWNLDDWQKLGFKDRADAEYWEKSCCGILCLKMAIDSILLVQGKPLSRSIKEYIDKGLAIGAYTDAVGWSHSGLAKLAKEFGFAAEARQNVKPEELREALKQNCLPIISIKWAFENTKSLKEKILFWKKLGGHLALVVGFDEDEDGKINGFCVHHTSIRKEYNWQYKFLPLDKFKQGFTGRCIMIKP